MQDVIHQFVEYVREEGLVLPGFDWIIVFDLLEFIITKVVTYEFGAFLEPEE